MLTLLLCAFLLQQSPSEWVENLGDPSFEVRAKAYSELVNKGEKALPALRAGENSQDPEVQAQCRKAIAEIQMVLRRRKLESKVAKKDVPTRDKLFDLVFSVRVPDRIAALKAMRDAAWASRSPAKMKQILAPAFQVLLEDRSSKVRLATIKMCGEEGIDSLGPRISSYLEDEDIAIRRAAVKTVVKLQMSIPFARGIVDDRNKEAHAIIAETFEKLKPFLKDPDEQIRMTVLKATLFNPPGGSKLIVEALKDPSPKVQRTAAEFARLRQIPEALPIFRSWTRKKSGATEIAVRALGEMKDSGSEKIIADLLRDKDTDLVGPACLALADLGASGRTKEIARVLTLNRSDTVAYAAISLARLGATGQADAIAQAQKRLGGSLRTYKDVLVVSRGLLGDKTAAKDLAKVVGQSGLIGGIAEVTGADALWAANRLLNETMYQKFQETIFVESFDGTLEVLAKQLSKATGVAIIFEGRAKKQWGDFELKGARMGNAATGLRALSRYCPMVWESDRIIFYNGIGDKREGKFLWQWIREALSHIK